MQLYCSSIINLMKHKLKEVSIKYSDPKLLWKVVSFYFIYHFLKAYIIKIQITELPKLFN